MPNPNNPSSLSSGFGIDANPALDDVIVLQQAHADQEYQQQALAQAYQYHAPGAALGGTGTAFTPSNAPVDFQYAAVPAASLITSHGLDLSPNAAYDQSLQGRDRGRAASAEQIAGIASGLNPERLGANASVGEGAPIIGPDFQVESGNGRSLGILSAYSQGLPSAAAYQSHLTENAGRFGLDPSAVAGVENPVLVRIRQTEMDTGQRAQFAAQANMSSIGVMSDVERAQRDAHSLRNSNLLPLFRPSEAGGINPASNREFLAGFAELLPQSERGAFAQADGSVSTAGVRQAQNALLAAAYPNPTGLSRMLESTDDNTRNIGAGMLSAAGDMAGVRQGATSGTTPPLDISGHVSDAANLLSRLRDQGTTLATHLATPSMFEDGPPQITKDVAQFLDANKRSGKRIGQVLSAYAESVQSMGSPDDGDLFGMEPPTAEGTFAAARARVERENGVLPSAGGPVVPDEIAQARAQKAQAEAEDSPVRADAVRARAGRASGAGGAERTANKQTRPYQQVRSQISDITADLKDLYTVQRRPGEIGKADFKRDLAGQMFDAGLGPEPPEQFDPADITPYKTAQKRRAGVEAMVRDDYALRDEYDEIDKPGFQKDVKAELVLAGLKEAPKRGLARLGENIKEDWAEPSGYGKLNYGYALAQGGQEFSQYYTKTHAGQYLTPEQNQSAQSGMLGGAGALLGTAIGSMVAPGVGSWVGGMIGGGAGQAAAGVVGANEEKAQASRQIGEMFATSLGEAASKVKEFSAQIEATGAPLKQVQAVLGSVAGTAPLGAGAASGAGAMTNALGEYAEGNYASVTRQVRSPAAFGLALELGQNGRLSAEGYRSLGVKAAIEGDAEGLQQDDLAAQRSTLADNPRYQAAQKQLADAKSITRLGGNALTAMTGNFMPLIGQGLDALTGYRHSVGFEENNPGDPSAKARAELFKQFGLSREAQGLYESESAETSAQREGVAVRGGSAAQVAAQSIAVKASYALQASNLGTDADTLRQQIATNKDPALDTLLRSKLADDLARQSGAQNKTSEIDQQDKANAFGESAAAYGLVAAQSQGDLIRGIYGGQSFAQRQGAEQSILSVDASRAAELRREAYNPLNSPAQRNQILSQATELDTQQAQQAYSFQQNAFGEEQAGYGLTQAKNQGAFTRARLSGQTYDQMQGVENESLAADTARANHLRQDAAGPNVTYADRLRMQGEATSLDTGALQQKHEFESSVYTQRLGQLDNASGVAGLAVTRAGVFGSGEDVYKARGGELDTYKAKIAELTSELSKGSLTADERIAKERQLTQVQGQAVSASFARDQGRYSDASHLAETELGTATTGLSRTLRRGGNAAVSGDILKDSGEVIADAQAHLDFDLGHYGGNRQLIADDRGRVASAQNDRNELLDAANTYRPTGAVQRQIGTDRANYNIAQEAPYLGGPGTNPFTAGAALIADYQGDMGRLDANRSKQKKAGLWRDEDETTYSEQRNSDREQIAGLEHNRIRNMFSALPEQLEGGVSRGTYSAILPTAAMASLFSPVNDPTKGGWATPTGGAHGGTFPMNSGPLGLAMGKADDAVSVTRELLAVQRQMLTVLSSRPGGSTLAPSDMAGGVSRQLGNSFNPNRAGG